MCRTSCCILRTQFYRLLEDGRKEEVHLGMGFRLFGEILTNTIDPDGDTELKVKLITFIKPEEKDLILDGEILKAELDNPLDNSCVPIVLRRLNQHIHLEGSEFEPFHITCNKRILHARIQGSKKVFYLEIRKDKNSLLQSSIKTRNSNFPMLKDSVGYLMFPPAQG